MGRALAGLVAIPWLGCDLPVLDPAAFGELHARRVRELGDRLDVLAESVVDWARLCLPEIPGGREDLVFTHGDPGPSNYLDDLAGGTLIDWEAAYVAPIGPDFARAVFIAHLGSGPSGYLAQDRDERALAVSHGYLSELGGRWHPTLEQLRWWLAVAGIQFVHRRWERADQRGVAPWSDALVTLVNVLTAPAATAGYSMHGSG
jgi:aminoglycoside phosphotransferase (APT) family kinase protein